MISAASISLRQVWGTQCNGQINISQNKFEIKNKINWELIYNNTPFYETTELFFLFFLIITLCYFGITIPPTQFSALRQQAKKYYSLFKTEGNGKQLFSPPLRRKKKKKGKKKRPILIYYWYVYFSPSIFAFLVLV